MFGTIHWIQIVILCIVTLTYVLTDSPTDDWDYASQGPSTWHEKYPDCAGSHQSPIDLKNAIKSDDASSILMKSLKDFTNEKYKVENNGKTLKIVIPDKLWQFGRHGHSQYIVDQIHFHWGSDETPGSEHAIEGKKFTMETHIVGYAKEHQSFQTAMHQKPGGLSVLAIFGEKSDDHTSDDDDDDDVTLFGIMGDLQKTFGAVSKKGESTEISAFNLTKLLLETKGGHFYKYSGSLTTPPCTESVLWIVFDKPIPITSEQLSDLRKLKLSDGFNNNYRPLQDLHGREVTKMEQD